MGTMKIKLAELADAFAQSDVLPGYVDLVEGRVILLHDDWQDDAAMAHAMRIEDDFERYVPLTNVCDSDEHEAMQAFVRTQPREVRERLSAALTQRGGEPPFPQGDRAPFAAGSLAGLLACPSERSSALLLRGKRDSL